VDEEPSGLGVEAEQGQIRTFLIADVRGWTLFTQQRGDEVAAKLAAKFAAIAREVVAQRGGEVIELRGDEALAVFSSTRQAVRAAVDLQERFVDETIDDPELPLPVGIGLDAGEAVPVEGGYRGGALNLAARLCGQAKAGEILASRGATHLARKVEGVRYLDKGTVRLKNLTDPVELVRVVPEGVDPAERLRAAMPAPEAAPRRPVGRILIAAAVVVALAVTVVVVLVRDEPATISAGAVGLLGASGDLRGSVEVGELPTGVARGLGALWITDQQSRSVVRVDPTTFRVDERIPVGEGPTGVTTAGGLVWVANTDDRTISVVDPNAHRVVDTVVVGNGPAGIVADDDRVWVANSVDSTVTEIDADDGAVVATYPVGDRPVALAAASGAIWVANEGGGTVSRIASGDGVTLSIPVGRAPVSIAHGAGALWVANADDGTVTRIDPSTGTVTGTARLGGAPVALTAGAEAAWAADASGTIERIDASTTNVTDEFEVGNAPRVLTADGDGVWVGVQASPDSHRGGTLRIVSEGGVSTIDPADPNALAGPPASVVSSVYDGLVTFRRAGGAAGLTVVADLAATVPVPTDDGRTYTFRLRDGIRFSDGREVGPQDVVATFERIYTTRSRWARSLLPELDGGSACAERDPVGCDVSRAVIADEGARTVTFRLARRAPDFLTILAGLNFVILPAGTPLAIEEPVPGTGPYVISEIAEGGSAVLTRNEEFREWSADAQPSAFADRVEITAGVIPPQQVATVEEGEADLAADGVPHELLEALDRRASDQLARSQTFLIFAFALDTLDEPFENVDARRAFASALDRTPLAELFLTTGIVQEAPVTCQMIPPSIPGYAPYCPFGRPGDVEGSWAGPDLTQAQGLVRRSGTSGDEVVVAITQFQKDFASRFVPTLRDLGYDVEVRIVRQGQPGLLTEQTLPPDADISLIGWIQAYPSAAEFLVPLLACPSPSGGHSIEGVEQNSFNPYDFCRPELDRRMQRALDLKLTDPYASARAFEAIDHDVVDLSPMVPYVTGSNLYLVSERVGNVQANPQLGGVLISQMWIR
jgi:YVTN family beta-propeller protein